MKRWQYVVEVFDPRRKPLRSRVSEWQRSYYDTRMGAVLHARWARGRNCVVRFRGRRWVFA